MTDIQDTVRVGRIDGRLDFDPASLAAFFSRRLGQAGRMDVARVGGGQSNPTYFVAVGGQEMVLRKRPNGATVPSAHAIDREFRVLQALVDTPVPTPRPLVFRAECDTLGTPFYLMERLRGRVFRDSALPGVSGPLEPFHIVFALFRFAVIFVGIADRARAGTAADAEAAVTGRLARTFAKRALEIAKADEIGPLYPALPK